MKKKIYLGSIALSTLIFFSSCSSCTKSTREKEEGLPKNPTQGQIYVDNGGHSWVYDAILMRWALSGGSLGSNTSYYYYPSSGRYEDNLGKKVDPPTNITKVTESTSNKNKISSSSSSKPTNKKSVFGKTGRSHSIGA